MNKKITNKIEANPKLVQFINKILSYNEIFNNEISCNMLFDSLISTDYLIDKYSCEETISIANFILSNIDLFVLENNIRKDVIKKCKNTIKIAKRDIKNFK